MCSIIGTLDQSTCLMRWLSASAGCRACAICFQNSGCEFNRWRLLYVTSWLSSQHQKTLLSSVIVCVVCQKTEVRLRFWTRARRWLLLNSPVLLQPQHISWSVVSRWLDLLLMDLHLILGSFVTIYIKSFFSFFQWKGTKNLFHECKHLVLGGMFLQNKHW